MKHTTLYNCRLWRTIFIVSLFSTICFAEEFNWKAFDLKLGLGASIQGDYESGVEGSIEALKYINNNVGLGLIYSKGSFLTTATDVDSYNYTSDIMGVIVSLEGNLFWKLSLVGNFAHKLKAYQANFFFRVIAAEFFNCFGKVAN